MPSPSPPQLALALAVVRAKPLHLDIKDHILQIRQFIKDKRASKHPEPQDAAKFFDSVAFWQQSYEKSEAEQSRLLDRIYELESRNEALVDRLHGQGQFQTGGADNVFDTGKRKGNEGSSRSAGARKRAKTQAIADPLGSRGDGVQVQGLGDAEYLEEATASFMRQFYTLQKAIQKRPNRSSIILAAVSLCKAAETDILSAVEEKVTAGRSRTAALQTERPGLPVTVRSVECAFQLLCQALGRLSGTGQDVRDTGQLTYHIICLYDSVMTALQRHCQAKAQQETANTNTNARSKKQKSRRTKTVRTRVPSKPEDETATRITRLLGTMALSLNISSSGHRELIEGFLFIVLTRVGKLLCLFVFQDLQLRPDLYIDPSKIPLPDGLQGADMSEEGLLAAQMEAKRLIWLLERILARSHADSSLNGPSSETVDCRGFVERVKDTLQSTLLQAVFGTDPPFFREALQRPIQPDLPLDGMPGPPEPEKPTPDWFVQEVWRLLGWEMLMNEN